MRLAGRQSSVWRWSLALVGLTATLIAGGTRGHAQTHSPDSSGFLSVAFSPDSEIVATGGCDKSVELWRAATGARIAKLQGHTGPVRSVEFSPDGKLLASGAEDCTVVLWDAQTLRERVTLQNQKMRTVQVVTFSPDGKSLATGSWDREVRIWDTATGSIVHAFEMAECPDALAYLWGGKVLAALGDGEVRVWDVATGRAVLTRRIKPELFDGFPLLPSALSVSPDGKLLAIGQSDGLVLWDAITFQELRRLSGRISGLSAVTFSPRGNVVATAQGGSVGLWDLRTGQTYDVIEALPWNSRCKVALARDGKSLAVVGASTGDRDDQRSLRLYDISVTPAIALGH